MKRRLLLLVVLTCALVVLVFGVAAATASISVGDSRTARGHEQRAAASAPAGSDARFAFLSRQHSNRCSLQAAALRAMPMQMRLQGSCCFPMNRHAYRSQVAGLRAYARVDVIPRDPYDISVGLARRLFAYARSIRLSPPQARVYAAAMRLSDTKGPCCCHCWRWTAFMGMSKYLIARRGWSAADLARAIDLVEGCGGPLSA